MIRTRLVPVVLAVLFVTGGMLAGLWWGVPELGQAPPSVETTEWRAGPGWYAGGVASAVGFSAFVALIVLVFGERFLPKIDP
jgi:hypothetical protein